MIIPKSFPPYISGKIGMANRHPFAPTFLQQGDRQLIGVLGLRRKLGSLATDLPTRLRQRICLQECPITFHFHVIDHKNDVLVNRCRQGKANGIENCSSFGTPPLWRMGLSALRSAKHR
jgi:hypothetical protein